IGADGAVNASSLMVTALALRAIAGADGAEMRGAGVLQRTTWMTLCVLSKPPMVAFILLEPMIHRWRALPRAARTVALVALPGLAVSLVWIWAVDAEMAAWRLTESGTYPTEHFRLGWKLEFMLENPLHFPAATATTLWNDVFGLWRQTIGVLGWLDTHLDLWVYVAISLLLVVTALDAPALPPATRLRVALWGTLLIVAYGTAVFAILFITWTPPTEPQVWGVQGRYFVPVLPVAALVLATLGHRLPRRVLTIAAIIGALIAGLATIEGLWRVNWVP
ncbi:DUF2142 domain-containing protein, partial [Rhodoplanes sp. SY1]|uniref:DUF2142 domain-containing protein n=1 Tax=Rhodoplanes sp. SY1 TaxID=3166646 RepID=UPI0038B5002E